jgi:hypothetical protein
LSGKCNHQFLGYARCVFCGAQKNPDTPVDASKRVFVVASDPATANQFNEMLRRVRECMFALERFTLAAADADENNQGDMDKVADAAFEMAKRLVQQYPNPSQFNADMESLRQMRTEIRR